MLARLKRQWFLLALAICFSVGYFAAASLQPLLGMEWLRSVIVFAVMWVMGVTLRAETIRDSVSRPRPSLLAIGINILAVPLLTLPTAWLLPEFLFGGLFVTAIVPCTLASASVWTRKAGGDDSIAMMTTVVTNLACVAVVPLGIWLVLSRQVELQASDQIGKLAMVVVAPLALAQLMRRLGMAEWADRNKFKLSICGQLGILAMVILGAAASALTIGGAPGGSEGAPMAPETSWGAAAMLLLATASIHLGALAVGVILARWLGIAPPGQIAVGIAGSQKTLMVGLQIAIDCGVSVVPMLVYHLGQLTLDTLVADRWKRRFGPEKSG